MSALCAGGRRFESQGQPNHHRFNIFAGRK